MEITLPEKDFNLLSYEIVRHVKNPFSEDFEVHVCNNCGCLIAPIAKESEILPNGVKHSTTYLENYSFFMHLCVDCNKAYKMEIKTIKDKYKNNFEYLTPKK